VARFVRSRVMLVLIVGLITGAATPSVAAKNDACRVGCKTEKQACRDAYKEAFQTSRSDCTGEWQSEAPVREDGARRPAGGRQGVPRVRGHLSRLLQGGRNQLQRSMW